MRQCSRSPRGFTMLEIMIAVLILGIVLTTVYGAYTGTLRIVADTEYADEVYGMARCAVEQITRDLESVCRFNGVFTFVSKEQEPGSDSFVALRFVSSRHIGFGENDGGITEITYYAAREDDGADERYRVMRRDMLLQKKDREEDDAFVTEGGYALCEKVQAFSWTFFNSNGEEYDHWDSESGLSEQKGLIPALARVRIDFANPADDENPYRFVTTVYIPAVESGKLSKGQ